MKVWFYFQGASNDVIFSCAIQARTRDEAKARFFSQNPGAVILSITL